jgi:hypothetical protein
LDSDIDNVVFRDILVKLESHDDNQIIIGPVDRSGAKVQNSINYMYEGIQFRLLNLLSFLYPRACKISGIMKFTIHTMVPEFNNMINKIQTILNPKLNDKIIFVKDLSIKTKLWDHQKHASDDIIYKIKTYDKKGFGDASNVGAGKTLTALSVFINVFNYQKESKVVSHYGFLVMLPTEKLYKTWTDEIDKHIDGFDYIIYNQNGKYDGIIKPNTIFITTLGRMRDHPFYHPWSFVVIDECLSVQNKNALQTEESWRQIINSKFGVLMMSATFFRSRFDKLFYMLKMLRTGLPEDREYLDTILSTSITCSIPENQRKWITNTTKFKLTDKQQNTYDKIKCSDKTDDMKYSELIRFINKNVDYVKLFSDKLEKMKKNKCLIYAKSKNEADKISELQNVTRYPDKTGQHVVVSYAEATYGLNDLVIYDTILTRVPEPDKLPQMKGRLDRPGQKSDTMNIEFILIENTLEDGWLLRLEMCNHFYKNYIMPLADFYKICIKQN